MSHADLSRPPLAEILGEELNGVPLSPRERQILLLASDGMLDKNIARELGLTPGTVRTYWVRLRAKTGTRNRAELLSRVLAEAVGNYERQRLSIGSCLESVSQAVLIVDHEMRCRAANIAAADLLGYPLADVLEKSLGDLFPEPDSLPILCKMRDTLREGRPVIERFQSRLAGCLVDMTGHPTDEGSVFVISRARYGG